MMVILPLPITRPLVPALPSRAQSSSLQTKKGMVSKKPCPQSNDVRCSLVLFEFFIHAVFPATHIQIGTDGFRITVCLGLAEVADNHFF